MEGMNFSQYQLPMEVGEEYKIASELNEVCDESNHEANLINICRLLVYLWFSFYAKAVGNHNFRIPHKVVLQDMPCGQSHYNSKSCSRNYPEDKCLSSVQDHRLGLDIQQTKDGNAKTTIRAVQQANDNEPLCTNADMVVAYYVLRPFWETHSCKIDAQHWKVG